MVLGQTTATAAAIAIDDQVAVQNVDYERLANRLLEDKQVLAYTGPEAKPGIDPKTLDGIVVDNSQAKTEGAWMVSNSSGQRVGMNYLHDSDASKGECVVVYQAKLKRPGRYQVNLLWPVHPNRASNTLVAVTDASGKQHAKLGEFKFDASAVVEIRNDDSDGYVIADAVQFIPGAGASE